MKKFLFLLITIFLMISCQETYLNAPDPQAESRKIATRSFTIPVDSALSNLRSFLKRYNTRSDDGFEISDVFPIILTKHTTRAFDAGTTSKYPTDTLLYVANFISDKGYAILSATDLIPDNIIAIIDSGRLSEASVNRALTILENEKPILSEYPATGESIYSLQQYGDQKFINPNTVDFNNIAQNDTLVGNFIARSILFNSNIPDKERYYDYAEIFTSLYCIEYGINSRNIWLADRDIHPLDPGGNLDGPIIEGGDGYGAKEMFEEYSPWETVAFVHPLLKKYSHWHQESPFNDKCPNLFGKRLSAGCFPLAIAKILTYYKTPVLFSYKNQAVIWNELDNYNPFTGNFKTESGNTSAAILLRGIGLGCDSWYFPEGTFTWPSDAKSFLGRSLKKSTKKLNFNFDRCKNMLDLMKPLIVYAIPSKWKFWNSHAWNIDGYRIDRRKITYYTYLKDKRTVLSEKYQTNEMLHCDFGWSGRCNGYYVSGIFKSYYEDTELDYEDSPSVNFNYNHYVHIIVY